MINQVHDSSMALLPVDTDSWHNRLMIFALKEPIDESYTAKTYLYDAGTPDHWGTSVIAWHIEGSDHENHIYSFVLFFNE